MKNLLLCLFFLLLPILVTCYVCYDLIKAPPSEAELVNVQTYKHEVPYGRR